jgi:hypothetical protein
MPNNYNITYEVFYAINIFKIHPLLNSNPLIFRLIATNEN